MKKDDQNLTSGNPPNSDSTEASSSQPQQTDSQQTITPLEQTLAPLLQLIYPIIEAFAPIVQNYVPVLHYLFGPLQHITFSPYPPAAFPGLETPRNFQIISSPGNILRSASTSGAQSFHLQQINRYPTRAPLANLLTPPAGSSLRSQTTAISEECQQRSPTLMDSPSKRHKKELPSPSKRQKTGTSSFHNESLYSASGEATKSKEQMTNINPRQEIKATSPTKEASKSKDKTPAIHPKKKKGAHFCQSQTASTSKEQMISIQPRLKKGTLSSPGQEMTTSKEQMTALHPKQKKEALFTPDDATYVSREQVTSEDLQQKTGPNPIHREPKSSSLELFSQHFQVPLDTPSVSGEQHQTYKLSSSGKKKTRTLTWPTDSQFASKKHETAVGTKQKTKTFSHPVEVETFASRKKTTTLSLGNEEEKQSTSVETMSAAREQVNSEQLEMSTQTGLRPILGEPKSSSPDSCFKDNKDLEGTAIERDVDPVVERPSQFDQFICLECRARFPTQEKLLTHELIHFID